MIAVGWKNDQSHVIHAIRVIHFPALLRHKLHDRSARTFIFRRLAVLE
jgi:hypothetical protein